MLMKKEVVIKCDHTTPFLLSIFNKFIIKWIKWKTKPTCEKEVKRISTVWHEKEDIFVAFKLKNHFDWLNSFKNI